MASFNTLTTILTTLALSAPSLALSYPAHVGVLMTGSGSVQTCTTATTTVTEQATVTLTLTSGQFYTTGNGAATSLTDGVSGPGKGPTTTQTLSTKTTILSTVPGITSSECVTLTVTSSWSNSTYPAATGTTTGVSLTDPIGSNPTGTGAPIVVSEGTSNVLSGLAMPVAAIVGVLAFFA